VQQLKLVKNEETAHEKMAKQEYERVKIECCGSFGLLLTENEDL
jgi:hypothetical protein